MARHSRLTVSEVRNIVAIVSPLCVAIAFKVVFAMCVDVADGVGDAAAYVGPIARRLFRARPPWRWSAAAAPLVPVAISALLACSSIFSFAAKIAYYCWLANTLISLARAPVASASDGLAACLLRLAPVVRGDAAWALVPKLAALATDDAWPSKRRVRAGRRLLFCAAAAALVAALLPRGGGGAAPAGPFAGPLLASCHDGDTCKAHLRGLPDVFGDGIGVRLRGVDAPEMRSRCDRERCLAVAARGALEALVVGHHVALRGCGRDKYFRLLCDVEARGADVAATLLAAGHVVAYAGAGPRHDWCAGDAPRARCRDASPDPY